MKLEKIRIQKYRSIDDVTINLPVNKLVGDLDYNLIRTPKTPLTSEEFGYCENDILVLYHYILKSFDVNYISNLLIFIKLFPNNCFQLTSNKSNVLST